MYNKVKVTKKRHFFLFFFRSLLFPKNKNELFFNETILFQLLKDATFGWKVVVVGSIAISYIATMNTTLARFFLHLMTLFL